MSCRRGRAARRTRASGPRARTPGLREGGGGHRGATGEAEDDEGARREARRRRAEGEAQARPAAWRSRPEAGMPVGMQPHRLLDAGHQEREPLQVRGRDALGRAVVAVAEEVGLAELARDLVGRGGLAGHVSEDPGGGDRDGGGACGWRLKFCVGSRKKGSELKRRRRKLDPPLSRRPRKRKKEKREREKKLKIIKRPVPCRTAVLRLAASSGPERPERIRAAPAEASAGLGAPRDSSSVAMSANLALRSATGTRRRRRRRRGSDKAARWPAWRRARP